MAPKARIADSPGLRIGVPVSTPKTPTLVIVIVPPVMSAGVVRPARAVSVRSLSAVASSASESRPASLMFGTMSPRGVAAAMPRLIAPLTTISCAASSHELLIIGWRCAASSTALATNSRGLTLTPARSGRAASRVRSFIIRVTSTVRNSVTCGAVNALDTIAAAVCLRTPLIGIRWSSPAGATAACGTAAAARSGAPFAASSTSARVMTPPGPLPEIDARSTPRSFAYLRTGGLASGRGRREPVSATCDGAASPKRACASAWRPTSSPPWRTGLARASGAVASSGGRSVPEP
jgi:hypothetical protein